MNSGKPFLVLTFFMLLIALFAGAAIGNTDLTPNTPPAAVSGAQSLAGDRILNTGACGSFYTVRTGDTLYRIAQMYGVTLQDILYVNPAISNANFIRPGQKINLVCRVTATPVPAPTATPGQPPINGLRPGGKVLVEMAGFPAKAVVIVTMRPVGGEVRSRSEVMTDAAGRLNYRVDIPPTANPGESWVVMVTTVNPPNVQVTTQPFTIEK